MIEIRRASAVAPLLLFFAAPGAPAQTGEDPFDRARALAAAGRWADARPLFVAHAERNPGDAEAQYWAGRAWLEADRSDRGQPWLERAVQLEPGRADYWLWLGRACGDRARRAGTLRARGLAGCARRAFERAVALDDERLDARSHLVDFHLEAPGIAGGRREEAVRQADAIYRRDAPRGLLERARVADALGRAGDAERLRAEYLRGPPTTDPKMRSVEAWLRGREAERRGAITAARAAWEEAIAIDPRNAAARASLDALR
jgi:tetratricopeptide (TPR) repeat protein